LALYVPVDFQYSSGSEPPHHKEEEKGKGGFIYLSEQKNKHSALPPIRETGEATLQETPGKRRKD